MNSRTRLTAPSSQAGSCRASSSCATSFATSTTKKRKKNYFRSKWQILIYKQKKQSKKFRVYRTLSVRDLINFMR